MLRQRLSQPSPGAHLAYERQQDSRRRRRRPPATAVTLGRRRVLARAADPRRSRRAGGEVCRAAPVSNDEVRRVVGCRRWLALGDPERLTLILKP